VRPCLKNTYHKKELVDCLNVSALSSNPSTAKTKKARGKKSLFWLTILEVSVPLLWACGSTVQSDRSTWCGKVLHPMKENQKGREKKIRVPISLSKTHPQSPEDPL
jgi:hypothetical protein